MKRVTKAREILADSSKRMQYNQSVMGAEIPQQPNGNMNDDENEDDVGIFNMNQNDHHAFPEYRNWWATKVEFKLTFSLR